MLKFRNETQESVFFTCQLLNIFQVHFRIGEADETAEFDADAPADDIKGEFEDFIQFQQPSLVLGKK